MGSRLEHDPDSQHSMNRGDGSQVGAALILHVRDVLACRDWECWNMKQMEA